MKNLRHRLPRLVSLEAVCEGDLEGSGGGGSAPGASAHSLPLVEAVVLGGGEGETAMLGEGGGETVVLGGGGGKVLGAPHQASLSEDFQHAVGEGLLALLAVVMYPIILANLRVPAPPIISNVGH